METSRSDANMVGGHGFQWWMPKPDEPAVPQQEAVHRAAQTSYCTAEISRGLRGIPGPVLPKPCSPPGVSKSPAPMHPDCRLERSWEKGNMTD